ncbi:hypothetical protein ANN_08406, partial [Periplaneta americana]
AELTMESSEALDVINLLECPSCHKMMTPPIFMCEKRHNVCARCSIDAFSFGECQEKHWCKGDMTMCPACQNPFTDERNGLAERLAEQLPYACPNVDKGCKEKLLLRKMAAHEVVCPQRLYHCVPCRPRCRWRGRRFQKSFLRKHAVENGSTRRVDILAYNANTKQGIIVDPTIRFEVECHQSAEVHLEKKSIYEPTVNYFKLKYALIHVETGDVTVPSHSSTALDYSFKRFLFQILEHMKDEHKELVWVKSYNSLVYENFDIKTDYTCTHILSCLKEIFWCHSRRDANKGRLFEAIQYIGKKGKADCFEYEFEFYCKGNNRTAVFRNKVQDEENDVEKIYESGDCLVLDLSVLKYFVNEKKQLFYNLKLERIRYKN